MDKSYTSEMYVKNKKEEVEIIRHHKFVNMLPDEEKEKVYDKCDKAIKLIEGYGKYVYNQF